ncbi:unnamed protein product, partial [marine sediment metagenome]
TFVRADWLTDWSNRKSIELTGSSVGQQTDYQVGVKVYYGAGADGTEIVNAVTFSKIYVDSKCQTDFDDIRFTTSDGSTELDYKILEKTDSNNAVIWVEIDTIPVDPDTVIFYIYYGNGGVSTTSNGDDTFLLYDHFDDSSIDVAKWDEDTEGGGLISESGTVLVLDVHPAVSSDSAGVRSDMTFTNDISIMVKRRQTVNN